MIKRLRPTAVAAVTVLAATTILWAAGAAASHDGPESHLDAEGLIATFKGTNAKGHVVLKRLDGDTDTLSLSLLRLQPGSQYRLRGSTIACGTASTAAATVLSYSFGVTNSGSAFRVDQRVTHDKEFEHWASLRLYTGGDQVGCAGEADVILDIMG